MPRRETAASAKIPMSARLYVGLMSGTSMDGIDCALARCDERGTTLLATYEHPIPPATKQRIVEISRPGDNEIERMGALDRELGHLFAKATLSLLSKEQVPSTEVCAIGSHGQTIRHHPPSSHQPSEQGFTLQIGDPNTIAQSTGITTVADFRRRDIAVGGEGAPLAPAFHAAAFAKAGHTRAIVNIGGIANVSLLHSEGQVLGFDTGPGNTLLDHWINRQLGQAYDKDGQWSAAGSIRPDLLARLLEHDYLSQSGPRSTGKEVFNLAWLDECLADLSSPATPQEVQSTLAEFSAESIARGIAQCEVPVSEVYVCGGGARNSDLMRRLAAKLGTATLETTASLGIEPEWVEAAAFAWLAWRSMAQLAGNIPAVTGAQEEVILGGIYPGARPRTQ